MSEQTINQEMENRAKRYYRRHKLENFLSNFMLAIILVALGMVFIKLLDMINIFTAGEAIYNLKN